MFRLHLYGVGTAVVDARTASGKILASAATYSVSGAGSVLEYPFFEDGVTEIRATFPATMNIEVI